MITVVCLSPSLDQTITLDRLIVGGTNRVSGSRRAAGGKGVNVAMTLKLMGEDVRLALFRHEQGAKPLFDALDCAGIGVSAIDVPGTLRVNMKLMDASCGVVTEINAQSEPVPEAAMGQMETAVAEACSDSRWLVLTGSLPKGYPADAYARLIRAVRSAAPDCRIALDAEGEPLRLGVMEKPDMIKPNLYELRLLTGKALESETQIGSAAAELVQSGVGCVLISMDKDGSLLAGRRGMLRARAVPVDVSTTVGAGDALLSGFIRHAEAGNREALAHGVAAAAARVAGRDGEWADYLPMIQIDACPMPAETDE